jgi:PAS domain S-box-containing protein
MNKVRGNGRAPNLNGFHRNQSPMNFVDLVPSVALDQDEREGPEPHVLRREAPGEAPAHFAETGRNGDVGAAVAVNDAASGNGGGSRRRPKERRGESDGQIRVLFENLPEPVFLLDPHDPEVLEPIIECAVTDARDAENEPRPAWSLKWPILECNKIACERHGFLRTELIGQPIGLIGPMTSQPEMLVNLLRKLEAEALVRFQALHRCKNGTLIPVSVTCARVTLSGRERVVILSRDLTQTRQPEIASGRLSRFIQFNPSPLLELDSRGQITFCNAAAERVTKTLGQPNAAALLPPNAAQLVKECLAARDSRTDIQFLVAGRTLSWSFCPVPEEQVVYACATDITRWLEPPCQVIAFPQPDKQEILPPPVAPKTDPDPDSGGEPWTPGELIRSAADPIIALDPTGILATFNPAAERLTGYATGEMVGRNLKNLPIVENRSLGRWTGICDAILAGGLHSPEDLEMIRCDGSAIVVEAHAAAIWRGSKPAGVQFILRDVTERKRAEVGLRKREATLSLVQKIARVGSWEMDVATEAMTWSKESFRIFDCRPDKFVPTRGSFYSLLDQESVNRVRPAHHRAIEKGESYTVEYRVVRADGSECWVHENGEAVDVSAGRPRRIVGTVQDITYRKQQEDQCRTLEKWESIGRLAGGVAHDFNAILTDIRRCSDLIQASPAKNIEIAPQLKQLALATERATNLTWQLLSLSRKQNAAPDKVDLNALIKQVLDMLQHVLTPEIQVELKLASEMPLIPAQENMLEQVLLNLIIHSRFAMSRGGRIQIESRVTDVDRAYVQEQPDAKPGRHVCLRITDTGGGVNATRMGCIHEPFFTTTNVGQGTGLGLATVHGIVKQHQGWIDVGTEARETATVRVYLPVSPAKTDLLALERPRTPISGGSETILLVEGVQLLRALARSILQRYGYHVLEAGSGAEALSVLESHDKPVNLLMTDMLAEGGVAGPELARQLQAKAPKLKVLFVSSHSASLTQAGCTLKPGLNFLPKPYSATALAQAVRNCLDRT